MREEIDRISLNYSRSLKDYFASEVMNCLCWMKTWKVLGGQCFKLFKTRCTRDITGHFFANRLVNRWNVLDQRTVDAPSLNSFKNSLPRIRDNRMGFFMDYM